MRRETRSEYDCGGWERSNDIYVGEGNDEKI